MYVSLYKLSIERYYIEGLYEVTCNKITASPASRQPPAASPASPASLSADQKTAEPPPRSSAVCHSRKVASQSR